MCNYFCFNTTTSRPRDWPNCFELFFFSDGVVISLQGKNSAHSITSYKEKIEIAHSFKQLLLVPWSHPIHLDLNEEYNLIGRHPSPGLRCGVFYLFFKKRQHKKVKKFNFDSNDRCTIKTFFLILWNMRSEFQQTDVVCTSLRNRSPRKNLILFGRDHWNEVTCRNCNNPFSSTVWS